VKVNVSRWVVTAGGLGRGEIEAMAIYKQLSVDALLIDDHRARVIAEHNQIQRIGALELLLVAKRRGIISVLAPYVRKLRQSSIFYGDDLLDQVLKLAGE
jgi:predicted nucleic acid-binding protein